MNARITLRSFAAIGMIVCATAGAGAAPTDYVSESAEDPVNILRGATVLDDGSVGVFAAPLPSEAFSVAPADEDKGEPLATASPPRVHPLLEEWLLTRSGRDRERIIVTFLDDLRLPRFPALLQDEPDDSPANQAISARTADLIRQVQEQRASAYGRLASELKSQHRADVVDTFWLLNAVVVEVALQDVPGLAARRDVRHLEPAALPGEFSSDPGPPPPGPAPGNDVVDGRKAIGSDVYFDMGLTGGRIGLLDTGVRPTHRLLVDNLGSLFDCTQVDAQRRFTCDTTPIENVNDECDHGTSSAAILSGSPRGALDDAKYRGVTAIKVDSYRIDAGPRLDCSPLQPAVLKALEKAIARGNDVIVTEFAFTAGRAAALGASIVAVNNAFDAGKVVVGGVGNGGPRPGTAYPPATAHKVIAVGAYDVKTEAQYDRQSRGPTTDGRVKPDTQGPTNVSTASNKSDTALRVFSATSGATPFVGGAAALIRNWLEKEHKVTDPGFTYAHLILSSRDRSLGIGKNADLDNTVGAGRLRLVHTPCVPDAIKWLPPNCYYFFGSVEVKKDEQVDIPLAIFPPKPSDFNLREVLLDAALWWPESADRRHSDVDLYLYAPRANDLTGASKAMGSVFERAAGRGAFGEWTLRIRGYDVREEKQRVYWAAQAQVTDRFGLVVPVRPLPPAPPLSSPPPLFPVRPPFRPIDLCPPVLPLDSTFFMIVRDAAASEVYCRPPSDYFKLVHGASPTIGGGLE